MTKNAPDTEFQSRMQQLENLLHEVDTIADAGARNTTTQVIQGLMDFHAAAIARIFDHLGEAGDAGMAMIDGVASDELVASLLLLYGLHPLDLETRVRGALEKVRPYLGSHGGNVELLGVSEEGVVTISMQGSCHSCPSSAVTLKTSIEKAIYERAPDVTAIHVQEQAEPAAAPATGFVPVEQLIASASRQQLVQGATS